MKFFFCNERVVGVLRILLGGIFVYAGAFKIQGGAEFADSIASFHLLPPSLISLLAMGLPPFEILTGALLVVGCQKRGTALAVIFMTTIFALALSQGLARGLQIDCGCFGAGKPALWKTWASLGRDLLLLGVALFIYLRACAEEIARKQLGRWKGLI